MVHRISPQGILEDIGRGGLDFDDPGLQFGAAGAFETLRVEGGRVHLHQTHIERLVRTLEFLQLRPGSVLDRLPSLFYAEVSRFPAAAALRLRLTVGLDPEALKAGDAGVRAFAEARSLEQEHLGRVHDRPPLRLHRLPDFHVSASDVWTRHKTTRYYAYFEARRRARLRGFDEALLLNEFGRVAEASAHNLFWIRGSRVGYPPDDAGALPGTFAAYIRNLAGRLGIEHGPAETRIGELQTAETLFLTNALGELRSVSLLDDRPIPPLEGSEIGRLLLDGIESERSDRADLDLAGFG